MTKTTSADRLDVHAPPRAIEPHLAVDQRENRVIATEPDVLAGEKLRPALPDDDVAGDDHFAAKFFHAQTFADAIAAVLNAALSFFMSHEIKRILRLSPSSSSFFHRG